MLGAEGEQRTSTVKQQSSGKMQPAAPLTSAIQGGDKHPHCYSDISCVLGLDGPLLSMLIEVISCANLQHYIFRLTPRPAR